MQNTTATTALAAFRHEVYHHTLGHRKDSLFELLEATLAAPGPTSLVRLTLSPPFTRRWASAPDALADGTLDPAAARRALAAQTTPALGEQAQVGGRVVWAVDGTTWPRPAARTSPERTWGHRTNPGVPQEGVVPAWEYQWVVAVPLPGQSWVLPLAVDRRGPGEDRPTPLALRQLRQIQAALPPETPRPVVTFDSNYDPVELGRAAVAPLPPAQRLEADVLVRLPKRRRFFRPPPPYGGKGAPRKHGAVFRLGDPSTHGQPDRHAEGEDARHGRIQVDLWEGLHDQSAADLPLTVIRIQVERLPQAGRRPQPLWLVWVGCALPEDLLDLWRWYTLRFTVEHGFRFLKHEVGWTTVRLRHPAAADRWSWLLALALWELWLARPLVADQRLPWERPLPAARLSPVRVRRALGPLLAGLGSPVRAVRPRGKSPGRRPGQCPGPRQRHPVVKRQGAKAA